jgi:hypothetical protein
MKISLCLAAGVLALPAAADTLYLEVSNVISADQPSATITAWATFDEVWYAFASGAFEIQAAEGGLSDPKRILTGPGSFEGWVSPDADEVTGIRGTQLHFPSAGIFANTANPIAVWQVTWTAENFHPREIDIWSGLPSRWDLYIDEAGSSKSFLNEVTVQGGTIVVVPGPWTCAVVALAVAGCRRRRLCA